MMKMKRPFQRRVLLAMSVALSLAGVSYADVLDKVPADALVVVKVNNLSATSGKVARLADTLGVAAFEPKLNDPLAAIKDEMKLSAGFKDDGELAFAYLDPKGGDKQKSMIVLVPVTDYNALVGSLEGATTDGAITTFSKNGQDAYIADWNGYAAVSPNKDLVLAAPSQGVQLASRLAKEMAQNDIGVYANIPALRASWGEKLTKSRADAKAEVLESLRNQQEVPEQFHAAIGVAVDQFFNICEGFLRDSEGATVGFSITDGGIRENVVAQFTEGSQVAKVVGGLQKSDATLLTGLPAAKYFFAGGATGVSESTLAAADELVGPILAALPQDDEIGKIAPELYTDLRGMLLDIKGQASGFLVPQGGFMQAPVFQVVTRVAGDGDALMTRFKAFNDKYAQRVADLTAGMNGIEVKQSLTEDAKEIDGVKFSLISKEIAGDTPEANMARQMQQMMYGAPREDAYFASTGDELISYMNLSDDSVKALIAAARGNDAPLAVNEAYNSVTSQLPKSRIVEAYVSIDQIADYGLKAASQFGLLQANIAFPPDLPPLGIAVSGDDTSLELTAYMPTDLMQALVTAGIQVYTNAAGGGGGRTGGGLE